MNWFMVYLWTRCDVVGGFIETLFFVSWVLPLFMFLLSLCSLEQSSDDYQKKFFKFWRNIAIRVSLPLVILFSFIGVLIPSSKDVALIYVTPRIINSELVTEKIPEEMTDIYKLAKTYMKEMLTVKDDTTSK